MEQSYNNIREPAVAGQFYPGDEAHLDFKINKYLKTVPEQAVLGKVKAILVPHAGYNYSAPVAAYAYKQLEGKRADTVVIICNSHAAFFPGIAIDQNDAWHTPLGVVPINKELANKLVNASPDINYNSEAHTEDHTLEVQVPFLQTVLAGEFKIVPILFGNMGKNNYEELAALLNENLGPDDLVVISTDMSHYPAYSDANRIDPATLEKVKGLDVSELEEYIKNINSEHVPNEETLLCGIDGVKTIITLAGLANWDVVDILHYANSGDVDIGDKSRVVGYGAIVFGATKEEASPRKTEAVLDLTKEQQKTLLNIARSTVESYVKTGKKPNFNITDERLNRKEGAFVTLHREGQLRGCIGQIIPTNKPLWEVVRDTAVSSCSEDHRFNPVTEKELDSIDYEISVLSVPAEIDDWNKIELGKHGVIVKNGLFNSGVFLPQVATETGWSKKEFLEQLCWQKAGLPKDCYKNKDTVLEVFTAQVFSEDDVRS
jgi:AmmeMemoRadiSam system protein B/AmmeMemoRadiSam system protein A